MAAVEDLESQFEKAAERMRSNTALSVSNEHKLQLYGYFKQAKDGHCSVAKPGFFDFTGRAKWEAWHKLGDLSEREAMQSYVELVSRLDPAWAAASHPEGEQDSKAVEGRGSGGRGSGVGPVVSTMAREDEEVVPDDQKTAFDWCKEGNVARLVAMVTELTINVKDEQGMSLLHWACDRGHLEVVERLASLGADLNVQDSDMQTPLHYATSCDQRDIVSFLLAQGVDSSLRDCDGATAEEATSNSDIKLLFSS